MEFREWWAIGHKPSMGAYVSALNQFCLYTRDKDVESLTYKDVMGWYGIMKSLGYTPNSFVTKNPALRTFFKFLRSVKKLKVIDSSVIPIPRQEVKMDHVKVESEYQKLVGSLKDKSAMDVRDKALILLTMDCGARIGEILSLRVGNINFDEKKAVIKTEKSRGMRPIRELCWTTKTNDALKEWLKVFPRGDDAPLFISFSGPAIGNAMSHSAAEDIFSKYAHKAKIDRVHPHEFRHRLGHILAKKGVSSTMISNILGHSSLQSSMRYTMMNHGEMKDTYHEVMGE